MVLLHIIIETRLRAACDEITKRSKLKLREKDIKGTTIDRARIFLNKVADVSFADQIAWQWLIDFQKVRDCIVHTNGEIALSRDNMRLNELCKSNIGLWSEEGILIVQHEYCSDTLIIAQKFFNELFESTGFGPSIPFVS